MFVSECRSCVAASGRYGCTSPNGELFLVLEDESISLWTSDSLTRLAIFEAIEAQLKKDGHFHSASWISNAHFACLTTFGRVKVFFYDGAKITQGVVLRTETRITALCGFDGYLFCGNEQGELVVMSTEVSTTVVHEVCDFPIKSIEVNRKGGILLTAAGDLFLFKVSDTLYSNPNSVELTPCNVQGHAIAISNSSFAAVGTGFVYLIEMNGNIRAFEFLREVTCVCLDGEFLVMTGPGYIATMSVWSGDILVRDYPELRNSSSIWVTPFDVILCSSGLRVFPFVRISNGFLFSSSNVWEYKALTTGHVSTSMYETNRVIEKFIGSITGVSGNDELTIAIGSQAVSLLDQRTGKWAILETKHGLVLHVVCCGNGLILVTDDGRERGYGLSKMLQNKSSVYQEVQFISIESAPVAVHGDERHVAVCFGSRLVLFDTNGLAKKGEEYELPDVPVKVFCVSELDLVFSLLKDYSLTMTDLRTKRTKIIQIKTKEFFVDRDLSILLVISTSNVLSYSELLNPVAFCELQKLPRNFVPIKAWNGLGAVVWVDSYMNGSLSQFHPILFARKDWKRLFQSISNLSSFGSCVIETIAFMLNSGMKVDREMIELTGLRISDLFAQLTHSKKIEIEGITCFELDEMANKKEIVNCYALLEDMRKEEGIVISLTSCLLLLELFVANLSIRDACLKFLEPILVHNFVDQGDTVLSLGISFNSQEYFALRRCAALVISCVVVALMRSGQPNQALAVARTARITMMSCLAGTNDSNIPISSIFSAIVKLKESQLLSQNDISELIAEIRGTSWIKWTASLMLLSPLKKDGAQLVCSHEAIRREIMNSEWRDVVDI